MNLAQACHGGGTLGNSVFVGVLVCLSEFAVFPFVCPLIRKGLEEAVHRSFFLVSCYPLEKSILVVFLRVLASRKVVALRLRKYYISAAAIKEYIVKQLFNWMEA